MGLQIFGEGTHCVPVRHATLCKKILVVQLQWLCRIKFLPQPMPISLFDHFASRLRQITISPVDLNFPRRVIDTHHEPL